MWALMRVFGVSGGLPGRTCARCARIRRPSGRTTTGTPGSAGALEATPTARIPGITGHSVSPVIGARTGRGVGHLKIVAPDSP